MNMRTTPPIKLKKNTNIPETTEKNNVLNILILDREKSMEEAMSTNKNIKMKILNFLTNV